MHPIMNAATPSASAPNAAPIASAATTESIPTAPIPATAPIAAIANVPPHPIVNALDRAPQDGTIAAAAAVDSAGGALVINNYAIEGIDDSSPDVIRRHARAFYTALIPRFESAADTFKIISKSKYNRIMEGLLRVRNGEPLAELRKEFSPIYYWNKAYAVVVAGGSRILVTRAKPVDEAGEEAVDTADNVVHRLTYIERVFCDILDAHGNNHIKGRRLYARVCERIHNISRPACKLFTDTCPLCIDRRLLGLDVRGPGEVVVDAKFTAELHCKSWIHLRTGKEFSRLLYPNPVCFLSTTQPSTAIAVTAHPEKPAATATEVTNHAPRAMAKTVGDFDEAVEDDTSDDLHCPHSNRLEQQYAGNVMVLSWLTPTNNLGRFVFSINKSRYTASLLAPVITTDTLSSQDTTREDVVNSYRTGIEFILSVPTRGMEQIVLDTGSISGRSGSKFSSETLMDSGNQSANSESSDIGSVDPISNRKRKKQKQQQLSSQGVAGLTPIPYCGVSAPSSPQTSLFAIDGTVAHIKCRTYGIMSDKNQAVSDSRLCIADDNDETREPTIDHDHLLVLAEVVDAHVHPLYWDNKTLIFRPTTEDVPPYLTFLGAQTFGYVKSS